MADARLQAAGNGFRDAALKITQCGVKLPLPRVAGNLRLMAMVKYAVRLQANFTEAVADRGLTTRAAHPAGSVDYRPLVEIQQIGLNQRLQRQLRRRRIAAALRLTARL